MREETKILTKRIGAYRSMDIKKFEELGGFKGLRRALTMKPLEVIEEIKKSGFTGRGGAGFPVANKWTFAANQAEKRRYLICNADEGELGTHKDRILLEGDPWAILEGILIASYAIGAQDAFIYIKDEYRQAFDLWKNIALAAKPSNLPAVNLHVVRGRGLYIAGEESALIASLGGRRPMSSPKPPYPAEHGLLGLPTVVNNVETLANVTVILADGWEAYRKTGCPDEPGTRLYSLSGDVVKPGVYELPVGALTVRELIDTMGNGVAGGKAIKAVQPGGGTSSFLTPDMLDCRLTTSALRAAGSSAGTAGMIVYSDRWNAVEIANNLLSYYGNESCGRCMPCRIGTKKMQEIISSIIAGRGTTEDLDRLEDIGQACSMVSTCGMGQAFPMPILSALKLFHKDFESRISGS